MGGGCSAGTYLSECTESILFFFTAKFERSVLWATCMARPHYVDVSLHSNKNQRSDAACVFECCCSQRSRTPPPIKARRGKPCFVRINPSGDTSGIETSPAPRFYVQGSICSLATQTLHIITCGSPDEESPLGFYRKGQ